MSLNLQFFELAENPDGARRLEFRLLVPPNIAQAAPRNQITVKLEVQIDGGPPLSPERANRNWEYSMSPPHMLVAALVEAWNEGRIAGLLQLTRDQLRQLLQPLENEGSVFSLRNPKQPMKWENGRLPDIHDVLDAAEADAGAKAKEATKAVEKQKAALKQTGRKKRAKESADSPALAPMLVDGSVQFLSITLPSRESVIYGRAAELLKSYRFKPEPSNGKWWLRDKHGVLNFLGEQWEELKTTYRAEFTKSFLEKTQNIRRADVQFAATETRGGFTVTLDLDMPGVEAAQIYQAIYKNQRYIETGGQVFLVDKSQLDKLTETQRKLSGDPERPMAPHFEHKISNEELLQAEDALELLALQTETPETWRNRSAALRNLSNLQAAPAPAQIDGLLRTYQRIGVAWLWHLYRHELGGILADEMGLGKTVQGLTLLACIHQSDADEGLHRPSLVVCPAGLVENWKREVGKFVPWIRVLAHHGPNRASDHAEWEPFDLIITSYGTLTRDAALFRRVEFACVLADEAQHIKNRQTQNARALRTIAGEGRFVLTGTPIENSLDDLHSLFDFIMPGFLQKPPKGVSREDRHWHNNRIRDRVAPYILRRTKQLVAPELPEKIEQVVFCDMGGKQQALYNRFQEQSEKEIFNLEMAKASEGRLRIAALNQLLRLRQICADPRLVEDRFKPEDSAKLRAFTEILEEALDGGHRMLVFSQFVSVLTLLREHLEKNNIPYCYLDGSTQNRLEVCDRFNNDDSIPVFLISLKAGGTGLNLTGADTVVHFDPWWNPAVEAQATDRAHRIGQTRVVTSIKLIAASTVEEKVLHLQATKAELLRELLDASDEANAKIGLDDIKALISSKK